MGNLDGHDGTVLTIDLATGHLDITLDYWKLQNPFAASGTRMKDSERKALLSHVSEEMIQFVQKADARYLREAASKFDFPISAQAMKRTMARRRELLGLVGH